MIWCWSRVSVNGRNEDGIRTILLAPGLGDTRGRDLETAGVGGSFELERMIAASISTQPSPLWFQLRYL